MQQVRVLVVEDESIVAEDIRDRLTKMGTTVVGPVATGEQALQCAEDSNPDIVLMDIRLKGRLDGVETADQIRRKFHIPVVYLTSHSDESTIERAKKTEPQGYLLKPFEESDLRVNIEFALSQHEMARRLRESEQRYATTLSSIGDAVIATDTLGRVTFMNGVAEDLTRWRGAEAMGRPLDEVFEIIDEDSRKRRLSPMMKALADGQRAELEEPTLLIARDGTEVPVDDCASPIVDADRKIRGGVLVFRDLSEKRRAAETNRKAQEQLQWVQRLEAIGRFAGGMAHEINNMLTVVIGCGEVLMSQLGAEHSLHATLETMLAAGDRTAALTRQLLAFSRKQVLSPSIVDPNQILQRLKTMFERLLGADIQTRLELADDVQMVSVDKMQWEQVLVNLALNARDAMPQGGTLTFRTSNVLLDDRFTAEHPNLKPGMHVRVDVKDTGCGMDAKTLERVFEPFFTTKEPGKGTGLGLATAFGIITQSGGHILVDSAPGKGSRFSIYLPAVLRAAPSPRPTTSAPTLPRGHETILLAEDEEMVRHWVSQALQQLGYTVIEAANGEEALQFSEVFANKIHLLLSDVVMPNLRGPEVAKKVHSRRPDVKVLFMSGYVDPKEFPEELRGKGSAFLQKPFSVTALANKVRDVLDGK